MILYFVEAISRHIFRDAAGFDSEACGAIGIIVVRDNLTAIGGLISDGVLGNLRVNRACDCGGDYLDRRVWHVRPQEVPAQRCYQNAAVNSNSVGEKPDVFIQGRLAHDLSDLVTCCWLRGQYRGRGQVSFSSVFVFRVGLGGPSNLQHLCVKRLVVDVACR